MRTTVIKRQVDIYFPLLSTKQQTLVLEMIKRFLNDDKDVKRVSRKQYNKEIENAFDRMEQGISVSKKDALKELSKW